MKPYSYNYEINWKDLINRKDNKRGQCDNPKYPFLEINSDSFLKKDTQQKKLNKSYKNKNKKIVNYIYGTFFVLFFIILFFLTTTISFAKSGNENISDDTIFSEDNSVNLLDGYIFEEEKEISNNLQFVIKTVKYSKYRVIGKETIEIIAKKFGLYPDTIILCNNIKKKSMLKSGRILIIPNQNGRIINVEKNDSLFNISDRYGVNWQKIADANNIDSSNIHTGMKLFIPLSRMTKYEKKQYDDFNKIIWPLGGKITSYFGPRIDPFKGIYSYHTGIDIKNKLGIPVKVCMDGIVVFTGNDEIYGNNIIVKHNNGYTTRYAHLHSVSVKKGDSLLQGKIIGTVGSTGRSTGSHLHFEIRKYGKLLNPLKVLE